MALVKNQRKFIDLDSPNVSPATDKKGKAIEGQFFVAMGTDDAKETQRRFMENLVVQKHLSKQLVISESLKRGRQAVDNDDVLYSNFFFDFRGRVYSSAFVLGLQQRDTVRSLICSANPRRLGERGLYWLASGVGTYWGNGIEKDTFDERVKWTYDRYQSGELKKIVDYALQRNVCMDDDDDDFLEFGYLWRLADDPGKFVGAAADFLTAMALSDPHEHKSARFIEFDATASGLQIMAAWTADKAATLVNVIPSPDGKRQDAYKIVADAVKDHFRKVIADPSIVADDDAVKGAFASEAAQWWLDFGIGRSLMKRPVMTFGYSAVTMTFYDQIFKETFSDPRAKTPKYTKYVYFLAQQLYDEVLPQLLPGTMDFMNRLRMIAEALAELGMAIEFTSEHGMPYFQREEDSEENTIDLTISIGRIRPVYYSKSGNISVNGQKKAICPNLVHHGDGLLVQKTVIDLFAEGVTEVITVHDCFGVLAADADTLYRIVRKNFVELFNPATLKEVWRQITEPLIGSSRDYLEERVRAIDDAKQALAEIKAEQPNDAAGKKQRLDAIKEVRKQIDKLTREYNEMRDALTIQPPVGDWPVEQAIDSPFLFS